MFHDLTASERQEHVAQIQTGYQGPTARGVCPQSVLSRQFKLSVYFEFFILIGPPRENCGQIAVVYDERPRHELCERQRRVAPRSAGAAGRGQQQRVLLSLPQTKERAGGLHVLALLHLARQRGRSIPPREQNQRTGNSCLIVCSS